MVLAATEAVDPSSEVLMAKVEALQRLTTPVPTARGFDAASQTSGLRVFHMQSGGDAEIEGRAEVMPAWTAFFQFADHPEQDLWVDGKHRRVAPLARGEVQFFDMRQEHVARLDAPVDTLTLTLPVALVEELSREAGRRPPATLRCPEAWSQSDPVLQAMAPLLAAACADPTADQLYLDHLGLAAAVHLLARYGEQGPSAIVRGGLSAWQERRAREMIRDQLDGDLSVARMAAECGLSTAHFARAFRRSTGATPHGWLQASRIERAKHLLERTPLSLAEAALQCGFADQSHFSRVFKAVTGATPARWRRERAPGPLRGAVED
ncbi:AraC family transcriptional regulator [Caulobacter segnis]|uniref:AraC family transcriptional regulator n=1 Tax=Caulobacter segnis TaxID=88688 RepID=UPI00240F5983|nr:AraC family transcriptional regulator [Caulobacter segnis]MDG2520460.1 AraC family transcriptional regulator [Caulobacter segnis]